MVADQQRLQIEVALALQRVVHGIDCVRATAQWSDAGRASHLRVRTWDDQGNVRSPRGFKSALTAAFEQLKIAMADPDKGAWLSVHLELAREGRFSFEYNYDRRVYWDNESDNPYDFPKSGIVSPGDDTVGGGVRAIPTIPGVHTRLGEGARGTSPVIRQVMRLLGCR